MELELALVVGGTIAIAGGTYFSYIAKAYPIGVYAYPVARIKVMHSNMLKEKKLQSLIESYTMDDVIAAFEGTIYEPYIPQSKNINEIEVGLNISLAETYKKVVAMSPTSAKEFFTIVSSRYDLENVKKIIAAKHAGIENPALLPSSFTPQFVQKLLDTTSVVEVVDLLKSTKYADVVENLSSQPTPSEVQRVVDKYLYETLLGKAKINILATVAGVINDSKFLPELYGTYMDIVNVKIALRCKHDGLSSEKTRALFLNNGYALNEKHLQQLSEADSVASVVSLLEQHSFYTVLNDAMPNYNANKKLFTLENALNSFLYATVKSIFMKQAFGLTPIACFLLLKEFEINTLKTILKGIESEIPKQDLQELIVHA